MGCLTMTVVILSLSVFFDCIDEEWDIYSDKSLQCKNPECIVSTGSTPVFVRFECVTGCQRRAGGAKVFLLTYSSSTRLWIKSITRTL